MTEPAAGDRHDADSLDDAATSAAAPREPFGVRLARAMAERGPLCVGIDPHPSLLDAWGLPATAQGLETFSLRALEAAAGQAAAVKPQVALYEAWGSAGFTVLERVLREAADAQLLSIADAKRGDIGSTMAAYAAAWLSDDSPLAADAVTLSPYLGFGSLRPALDLARRTGRGTFVLALTSNPEGAGVQHVGGADSVAGGILAAVARENGAERAGDDAASSSEGPRGVDRGRGSNRDQIVTSSDAPGGLSSCGVVIGATVGEDLERLGLDLRILNGPILAPGYGAQGADADAVATVFGQVRGTVLANSSRGVLAHGPSVRSLREAVERARGELSEALQER
ncbi:orotidine-5'-phosphate decarboxylase [Kocuria tytonicola]|uniref:Orotidine 5'-phosphate decarboxylase n=1 Tax=Kocuria tytonicola TaxID=2055946 RepID=A0A3L9L832_9MICC|nr:orotidine-5'-phosphate decarboxylase [Kocuria tytonicola]RLY94990.1 orotidine-5'-phosphate decarboxylase [Kocuria tytonicola]